MRRLARIRQTSFGPAAYVAEALFTAGGRPTDDRDEAERVARSWWDPERAYLGEEYGKLATLEPVELAEDVEPVELAHEPGHDEPPTGGATWSGVLAVEGLPTGDGRLIEAGALSWETPLPLRWVEEDSGAHDGARVVGIIDSIERVGAELRGRGRIDLGSEHGREVARQLAELGPMGVSLDLDDVTVSVRVAAELLEAGLLEGGEEPLEADADGRVEVARMSPEDQLLTTEAGRARAATLVAVPAFAEARIALDADQELEAEEDSIVAAAGLQERRHVAPLAPPSSWFEDPQLVGPTALTVTDDGRVYGHVATWGACHTGRLDTCTQPPSSSSDYAYFRTGALVTEDGEEVAVGRLTMDGPHASLRANADDAARHYDDSTRVAAYVAAGEDEHGIWIAGTLRADLEPEDVVRLRASSVSGDWRAIERRSGGLELLAVLAVNHAGFPTPRAHVTADAGAVALVASSGALARLPDAGTDELGPAELRLLRRMASRETAREAERLRAAVHGSPAEHAKRIAERVGLEA